MDVNDHPLHNKFYTLLNKRRTNMEEFSHKCWGSKEPYTHHLGKSPIDGGYKSLEVEIVNLSMLNFVESPGDHRSLLFDISTRSLLGEFRYKICHPMSRRLFTTQADSVKQHNEIVQKQFEIRRIVKRIGAVDKMTRYCGYLSPRWWRLMIIKMYKQMTKIRIHVEKKCRKTLRPERNFSPMVQMWYGRIHAYLQLIRMKEGKTKNTCNILRFA
jgi:hypothetical protein